MPWLSTQTSFAAALRDAEKAVPEAVSNTGTRSSRRRFNVYRNNVMTSLRESLEATFPVVRQIVGEEFFAAMAQVHIQEALPRSPVLLEYGSEFADFIAGFEPAAELPYLADVARLEYAWIVSFHAADASGADIAELANLSDGAIDGVRFEFHPSLTLLASEWPVFSIWKLHQDSDHDIDLAQLDFEGESGLLVRPALEVDVRQINQTAYRFFRLLHDGHCLGDAAASIPELDEVGLSELISALFDLRMVTALRA